MSVPIDSIGTALLAVSAVAAIVSDRVFSFDPERFRDGSMFSTDGGDVLASLSIDDQGGIASINGPSGSYQSYVAVWCYGPKTPEGRESVHDLMQLVIASLHGWQDPVSKALLMWGSSLGDQSANVRDAVTNYARFSVNGVHSGIAA